MLFKQDVRKERMKREFIHLSSMNYKVNRSEYLTENRVKNQDLIRTSPSTSMGEQSEAGRVEKSSSLLLSNW